MVYSSYPIEKSMYYGATKETFRKAKELGKNMTVPEKILWEKLRNKKINGITFRRQHPIDIFIADFYCHKYKLVIEIDGEIHNEPHIKEKDINRSQHLQNLGIKIIRFSNDEIINNLDNVIHRIKQYLKI